MFSKCYGILWKSISLEFYQISERNETTRDSSTRIWRQICPLSRATAMHSILANHILLLHLFLKDLYIKVVSVIEGPVWSSSGSCFTLFCLEQPVLTSLLALCFKTSAKQSLLRPVQELRLEMLGCKELEALWWVLVSDITGGYQKNHSLANGSSLPHLSQAVSDVSSKHHFVRLAAAWNLQSGGGSAEGLLSSVPLSFYHGGSGLSSLNPAPGDSPV